jgi:hypothetical protein
VSQIHRYKDIDTTLPARIPNTILEMAAVTRSSLTNVDNLSKSEDFGLSHSGPDSPVASSPITPHTFTEGEGDLEKTASNGLDPAIVTEQLQQSTHPRANITKIRWIVTLMGQYMGYAFWF